MLRGVSWRESRYQLVIGKNRNNYSINVIIAVSDTLTARISHIPIVHFLNEGQSAFIVPRQQQGICQVRPLHLLLREKYVYYFIPEWISIKYR